MTIVYFIGFLLVVALLYFAVHKCIVKLNLPGRQYRYFQCRQAALFGILILALANPIVYNGFLYLADHIMNIEFIKQVLEQGLVGNTSRVSYLYFTYLISNLLLMISFYVIVWALYTFGVVKRFCEIPYVKDLNGAEKLPYLPWIWAEKYYDFYDEDGNYCLEDEIYLNSKGVAARIWLQSMKKWVFTLIVIELVIGGLSLIAEIPFLTGHLEQIFKAVYMVPVCLFLMIEQLLFSLEGLTQAGDDGIGSLEGDEISEQLDGDVDALVEFYTKKFEGACLGVQVFGNPKKEGIFMNDVGVQAVGTCSQPEILKIIAKEIKSGGEVLESCYLNAIGSLLDGENVHVRDSILGKFTMYLASYLSFHIVKGRTILILCNEKSEIPYVKNAFYKAFSYGNRIESIWKMVSLDELETGADGQLLVCTYEDMEHRSLFMKRMDFFKNLSCVVFTDGADFFAKNGIEISVLFGELEKINAKLQYVFLSEDNNESLRTAFEYQLGRQLKPFTGERAPKNTAILLWKGESYYKLQRNLNLGDDSSAYMGAGIPLALAALRYDVPYVDYVSGSKIPYETYSDAMQKMISEIETKVLPQGTNLSKAIRFNQYKAVDGQELSLFVLHDEEYNFFNALWSWLQYGGSMCTIIHVITRSYLLRDYMVEHFRRFLQNQNLFDAFTPYKLELNISKVGSMLVDLSSPEGVRESQLKQQMIDNHWNFASVEEMLSMCIRTVIPEEEFYDVYEYFTFTYDEDTYVKGSDRFEYDWVVKLTNERVRELLISRLAYEKIRISKGEAVSIFVLKEDRYNYYLPGQVACFGGNTCRILEMNDNYMQLEEVMLDQEYEYMQMYSAKMSDMKLTDGLQDTNIIDHNLYTATVEKTIHGFWQMTDGNNLCDESCIVPYRAYKEKGSTEEIVVTRKNVQVLELIFSGEYLAGCEDRAALLLTAMLNGMLKTLFPKNHQDIFAATSYDKESYPDVNVWTEKCTFEERILSTIPHVDGDGMQEFCPKRNEDGQIAVYLVEFSCLEYGLIGAVVKDIQRLYRIIREYLEWTNANKDYEGLYLEYGASALPSCFAVNELFCLFAEICPPLKEVSQEQKDYELQGSGSHCTFCGRKTIFTHKLQDGRRMCNYCKNHQLTARQEIKEMFYETKSFLEKQYNIKIPDNLHIKFKSATAIKNKLGYDGEGRVLGFYHDGSKQVWIESRGPKICVQSTLMHELTHGWQYPHIDMAEIRRHPMYGLDLIEGHTSYVEVEGMKYLKEYDYSQFLHEGLMRRNDEYGNGYRMVCALMELGREQKGNSYTVYQLMSDISKSIAMGVSLEEIWNE